MNALDDRLAINLNVGEFWMLIDAHWISRWSLFVMGQEGPPGPISNRRLFGRTLYGPSGAATEMAKGYLCELPEDEIAGGFRTNSTKNVSRYSMSSL